jgi:diguanylate cyclase
MPKFDLKTIIFMSMLLTFMLSMLLAITRQYHKEVRGPGFWAVGNLVVGLGMVLVLMQLQESSFAYLPGMACIGAGLALYINGIQSFTNKQPDLRIPICVFVLLVAIDVFFVVMRHDIRSAVVLSALVFGAIYVVCARLTFSREEGLMGHLLWVTSSLFLLMGFIMFGRAMLAAHADKAVFDAFASWPVNAMSFMLGAVSQFIICSLFVLMLSTRLNQHLEAIATIDSLTGTLNRRGLEDAAVKMQAICKRLNLGMAVLVIDMDFFKKINDTHGHPFGDDVLRQLTNVINYILRTGDILGRYGGEEFCVFLPNTNELDAAALADRIRQEIATNLAIVNQKPVKGTVSIGVADSVSAGYDFKGLIAAADIALYAAKTEGRNRVASYTSLLRENTAQRVSNG